MFHMRFIFSAFKAKIAELNNISVILHIRLKKNYWSIKIVIAFKENNDSSRLWPFWGREGQLVSCFSYRLRALNFFELIESSWNFSLADLLSASTALMLRAVHRYPLTSKENSFKNPIISLSSTWFYSQKDVTPVVDDCFEEISKLSPFAFSWGMSLEFKIPS